MGSRVKRKPLQKATLFPYFQAANDEKWLAEGGGAKGKKDVIHKLKRNEVYKKWEKNVATDLTTTNAKRPLAVFLYIIFPSLKVVIFISHPLSLYSPSRKIWIRYKRCFGRITPAKRPTRIINSKLNSLLLIMEKLKCCFKAQSLTWNFYGSYTPKRNEYFLKGMLQ